MGLASMSRLKNEFRALHSSAEVDRLMNALDDIL